ncbi:hypothetical protein ACFWDQ_15615 [Streptomyces sp. NPDC060053]|uniref:hypothetical protein n=1 Tax=Streptomyces sp. NPDC060053 TaxID=3347047 RepID=UPI0036C7E16A
MLAPTFPPRLRRALPLAAAFARTAVHENPAVLPAFVPHYAAAGAGAGRLVRCVRSAQADRPENVLPLPKSGDAAGEGAPRRAEVHFSRWA